MNPENMTELEELRADYKKLYDANLEHLKTLQKETDRLIAENKRLDGVNMVLQDHITGLQSCLDRIEQIVGEDNS